MPVPKRRLSKWRTRIKRNEKSQKAVVNTVKCKKCSAQKLAHRVCEACGN